LETASSVDSGQAINDTSTSYTNFITYLPSFSDETLLPLLAEHNVAIEAKPDNGLSLWAIILNFLPIVLFFLLLYLLFSRMRQPGEGVFSLGRSQAKLYEQREEGTTFNDVAGLDGAKIELKEVIEYLKSPERVFRLGGTVPKGVLLVGPPGTGKTFEECRLIAYHEAGHAVLATLLPHADPIHKVTIVPRVRAMGVTQQLPEQEKLIYTREYMLDHLAVMMGGRAAEELVFDTATSGAENDLKQATQLASHMVLDWGMSQQLGHVALGSRPQSPIILGEEIAQPRAYSEATACQVDKEIKAILDTAYEQATDILRQHHAELVAVAQALLAREEISGEEVLALLNTTKLESQEEVEEVEYTALRQLREVGELPQLKEVR
jgi:ATP-dependent Zn protease